jgi:hypothetical protein
MRCSPPALIKEYLFGTDTVTDWQPGSPIVFQGEFQGQAYRDKGRVKEAQAPVRLSYSYWSGFSGLPDAPENHAVVTYMLDPHGRGTVFTWEQRGFPDESRHQHAQSGLKDLLQQIKTIAERGPV